MSLLTILWVLLIIYLVLSLASILPAPQFSGRNPVFVVLIIILLLFLLGPNLGLRWH